MKFRFSQLAMCIAFMIPVHCFSTESSPARFGDSTVKFIERLRLPDISEGETLLVKCASIVNRRGKFGMVLCYNKDDSKIKKRISRSIQRVANRTTITPATVEGKAVSVWFSFTVAYRQSGNVKNVQLLENHLYNVKQLDVDYISAQRYKLGPWRCFKTGDLPILATVTVSDSGEILDIKSSKRSTSNQCANAIIQSIENSKFIPASVDGNNVDSTYIEAFYIPYN